MPSSVFGIYHTSAVSRLGSENVSVEIICDPKLFAWWSLLCVVNVNFVYELFKNVLFDKRDAASSPACPSQSWAQRSRIPCQSSEFIKLRRGAVVVQIAGMMALVHELTQLLDFGVLVQIRVIADLSEVNHSFGFTKHMEGPFVKFEVFVLWFYLVQIGNVLHDFPNIFYLKLSLNFVFPL